MNMQQMMKQAQKMQRQLAEAQDKLCDIEVTGTAGGGMVTVKGTANGDINAIAIDGAQLGLDEDDTEMLQDTVLAAVNEMLANAQQVANQQVSAITGGLNMPGMLGLF
jgi:DNA-binding YbaB/EbfC family protein